LKKHPIVSTASICLGFMLIPRALAWAVVHFVYNQIHILRTEVGMIQEWVEIDNTDEGLAPISPWE
jgi:hypothetical protein